MEELKNYFQRLELSEEEIRELKVDKKSLLKLHQLHVQKIPFENLNIFLNEQIEPENLQKNYTKLTTRRRGGYCFEMNTIFHDVLKKLGFNSEMKYATVTYRPNQNPKTHIVMIVKLLSPKTKEIKEYLCDVSFGGFGLYSPLRLQYEKRKKQGLYYFRFIRTEFEYSLEFSFDGEIWRSNFGFNHNNDEDFIVTEQNYDIIRKNNHYNQYDPSAYFKNNVILSKVYEIERVYIYNRRFSIRRGAEEEGTEIRDVNQFKDLIFAHFQLSLTDDEIRAIYKQIEIASPLVS